MSSRKHTFLAPVLGLLLVAVGCRSSAPALPQDPTEALAEVERRLLGAESVRCFSELTAEGSVTAELRSEHQLAPDGRARVRVKGTFAGQPIDVVFESDGAIMRMVGAGPLREREALPDVFRGFVLGLSRMGWMHNAAMLANGGLPEGCDGKVTSWVEARGVKLGDEVELNGTPARALVFDVAVGGQVSGNAILWVSTESGLPLMRLQRVMFPEGEMRVSEIYEQLELNGRTEW